MRQGRVARRAAGTGRAGVASVVAVLLVAPLPGVLAAPGEAAAEPRLVPPPACDFSVLPGMLLQPVVDLAAAGDTVCIWGNPWGAPYLEPSIVTVPAAKAGLQLVGLPAPSLLGIPQLPVIAAQALGCTLNIFAPGVKVSGLVTEGDRAGGLGQGNHGVCFRDGAHGGSLTDSVTRKHRDDGVWVSLAHDVLIERVTSHSNGNIGIDLTSADRTTVRRATVLDNGADMATIWEGSGIHLASVTGAKVLDSLVAGSMRVGVYVTRYSSDVLVHNNTIRNNGDDGVNTESHPEPPVCNDDKKWPSKVTISKNTLTENNDEGVHVYSGTDIVVQENTIRRSNLSGIVYTVGTGTGGKVSKNVIEDNGKTTDPARDHHIWRSGVVLRTSEAVTVDQNTIQDHPKDGVLVQRVVCTGGAPTETAGALADVLAMNTIRRSGEHGVHLQYAQGVKVLWHPAIDDSGLDGIHADEEAHKAVIQGNVIDGNDDDGIEFLDTDEHLVEQNRVSNNGGHGIWLNPSDKDLFHHNLVRDNALDGFHFEPSSSGSLLGYNRAEDNGDWQIEVEAGAAGNTVWDNTFIGAQTGKSFNAPFTNSFFRVVGDCAVGNYWSDHVAPANPPPCEMWRLPTKWLDVPFVEEVDRGPWVDPPA